MRYKLKRDLKKGTEISEDFAKQNPELVEKIEESKFEYGQTYYHLHTNGVIIGRREIDNSLDKHLEAIGNKFATRKHAEEYREYLHALHKVRTYIKEQNGDWKPDWKSESEKKFSIYMMSGSGDFDWNWTRTAKADCKLPYIKTEVIAQSVIDEFDKELRIIWEWEE